MNCTNISDNKQQTYTKNLNQFSIIILVKILHICACVCVSIQVCAHTFQNKFLILMQILIRAK